MLFLDLWFWGFAAVALPGFWLLRGRAKLPWLVAASAVFHWYYAGPAGMAPILVLAVVTYGVGIRLGRGDARGLFLGIITLLVGALAFYKYSDLTAGTLLHALRSAAVEAPHWLATWSSRPARGSSRVSGALRRAAERARKGRSALRLQGDPG